MEVLQHDKYRLITAGLGPEEVKCRRGSQGVAIALSPLAVSYWEAGGSEVHTDLGARVIGLRLSMTDKKNKEVGVKVILLLFSFRNQIYLHQIQKVRLLI